MARNAPYIIMSAQVADSKWGVTRIGLRRLLGGVAGQLRERKAVEVLLPVDQAVAELEEHRGVGTEARST